MTYAVKIDEGACPAHGDCADLAPVFGVVAQAYAPTAIRIVDQQTGEPVYP